MTTAGWFVMIAAVGGMTALLSWCIYKVLTTPEATSHVHAPLDIDTHDKDE